MLAYCQDYIIIIYNAHFAKCDFGRLGYLDNNKIKVEGLESVYWNQYFLMTKIKFTDSIWSNDDDKYL